MESNVNESLYKEIVNDMLEGVMVISMNGRITMLNPAAEKILGLTKENIGDLYMNIFLEKADNDAFNEVILDTIYAKKKVSNMPIDYVLSGEVKNLSLTTSYVQDQGEKSVLIVMDDVTQLNELRDARIALEKIKKLNTEYEKAKNDAILANETKSRFLSNMSHEIRTPINAVLGMNEMILRECEDNQILTYAANIESSGKTLLFLINDILDMSKIESGKMEIIPVEYEPATLIMDLWNVIYLRAQEKNLKLSFFLDKTLPKVLLGDDVRIKQIVTNLLTNAVKYTPQGSVELKMEYKRLKDNMMSFIISVKDTGIGIKKEDMGKLFESFQRLDEEKNRKIEGTSLGMNITMSLLNMMGGEMKVESEYQKGSVFTVIIPQKIVCDEPTGDFEHIKSLHEKVRNKSNAAFCAPDANILVVDDNAMNLTVFKALLKRTKVNIVTASSGRQCLELVEKEKFDIIFMDHMMPEMDGIETFHRLKHNSAPVIALTANAVAGAKEFYLNEGFHDFLTKPIDGALLENMIASYLPKELIKQCENASKDNQVSDRQKDNEKYQKYGISIEHGVSYSNGDMEVYLDLVYMFLNEGSIRDKLYQYMSEKNMNEYAVLVHSLKGNARTLGADRLADIAYEHEMKSKANNYDFVKSGWNDLVAIWDTSLEGFKELYHYYRSGQEEKYRLVDAKDSEILELKESDLSKVVALIDDFKTDKAVEQLKIWINSPLKPEVHERIKNALIALEDEFDEDKAMLLLSNSIMEGQGD